MIFFPQKIQSKKMCERLINSFKKYLYQYFIEPHQLKFGGSFALGVDDKESDLDTVLIIACVSNDSRLNYFNKIYQILLLQKSTEFEISDLEFISKAKVPIITMILKNDTCTKDVDLTISCVKELRTSIFDLQPWNEESNMALGGPRHAQFILDNVKNPELYRQILDKIRTWAKARKIYGSKYGYLGGIAWSIMVAHICRMPLKDEVEGLKLFFCFFNTYSWRKPFILQQSFTPILPFHMAIISPVVPLVNCTQTVNEHTLKIIQQEFQRAVSISEWSKIIKSKSLLDLHESWKYIFQINFTPHSKILAKLLKLTFLFQSQLKLSSIVWPQINQSNNLTQVILCLTSEEKGSKFVLAPILETWEKEIDLPKITFKYELQSFKKYIKSAKKRKLIKCIN